MSSVFSLFMILALAMLQTENWNVLVGSWNEFFNTSTNNRNVERKNCERRKKNEKQKMHFYILYESHAHNEFAIAVHVITI